MDFFCTFVVGIGLQRLSYYVTLKVAADTRSPQELEILGDPI